MNPIDKYCSDFHLQSYQDIKDGKGMAKGYFRFDIPKDSPLWYFIQSPDNQTVNYEVVCDQATSFGDIFATAKKELHMAILAYGDNLHNQLKKVKEAIDSL